MVQVNSAVVQVGWWLVLVNAPEKTPDAECAQVPQSLNDKVNEAIASEQDRAASQVPSSAGRDDPETSEGAA